MLVKALEECINVRSDQVTLTNEKTMSQRYWWAVVLNTLCGWGVPLGDWFWDGSHGFFPLLALKCLFTGHSLTLIFLAPT